MKNISSVYHFFYYFHVADIAHISGMISDVIADITPIQSGPPGQTVLLRCQHILLCIYLDKFSPDQQTNVLLGPWEVQLPWDLNSYSLDKYIWDLTFCLAAEVLAQYWCLLLNKQLRPNSHGKRLGRHLVSWWLCARQYLAAWLCKQIWLLASVGGWVVIGWLGPGWLAGWPEGAGHAGWVGQAGTGEVHWLWALWRVGWVVRHVVGAGPTCGM